MRSRSSIQIVGHWIIGRNSCRDSVDARGGDLQFIAPVQGILRYAVRACTASGIATGRVIPDIIIIDVRGATTVYNAIFFAIRDNIVFYFRVDGAASVFLYDNPVISTAIDGIMIYFWLYGGAVISADEDTVVYLP